MTRRIAWSVLIAVPLSLIALTWVYFVLDQDWDVAFNAAISILAVTLSLASLLREKLSPFDLTVRVPYLIFPRIIDGNLEPNPIILTILFYNKGEGPGIVDLVSAKLIDENDQTRIYEPFCEMDRRDLLRAKDGIGVDTANGMFAPFLLGGKDAQVKDIILIQKGSDLFPPVPLKPGKYRLEVFVKGSQEKTGSDFTKNILLSSKLLSLPGGSINLLGLDRVGGLTES